MRFSVLSSGSRANCTYFESGGVRILIDCGLSGSEVERRLLRLGINPATLNAVIITHEHSDHIYGVHTISRRYRIPVYTNEPTRQGLKRMHGFETFRTGEQFSIGLLSIAPFSIAHDAVDPVGFAIVAEGLKFVQATDLGKVTPLVRDAMTAAHAVVLESNHDPVMLQECSYSWELKKRISSTHGHLSNEEAGSLLFEVLHDDLMHIVLGHLSENSNTPEMAHRTVQTCLKDHPVLQRSMPQLQTLICGCIQKETPLIDVAIPCSEAELRFVETA